MSIRKINLALGIHNHQPIGNFDFVFQQAYDQSYKPFWDVLEKHPDVRMSMHYSGILLEWIKDNHPELVKKLKQSVKSGQIEMMSGGYYEPILTSIPERDIVGQIDKLNRYVKKETGYSPTGIWLTERVWEPYLPASLAEAGIQYTVTDDSHFKSTGLRDDQLLGYYVTEHQGQVLKVFPICEKLRYTMPFMEPEATLDVLRSMASEDGERLVVFADDGEKFGVWPGTYEQCYVNGWLDRFFTLLEENLDWINIITFSEALQKLDPLGKVYLPTASYREMMEWAMPTAAIKEYERFYEWLKENHQPESDINFVKGGFWRNFLAKYPESNNLQKRMLHASNRYHKLRQKKADMDQIRDHIYAGQCNCPYWHGVFGGLYLPHLRYAIYNNLIQAERLMDQAEHGVEKDGWVKLESLDFDADGFDEYIIHSDKVDVFVSPHNGGSITELDYKSAALNLIDTMTRREEAYHKKLYDLVNQDPHHGDNKVASIHDIVMTKEEGLEKYLNYDWYRRVSLIDHFFHPQVDIDSFIQVRYGEQGDFANQPYDCKTIIKNGAAQVVLTRSGHVWIGDDFIPVQVTKTIQVEPGSEEIVFNYSVKNLHSGPVELWFGVEFASSFMAGNAPDRYYTTPEAEIDDPKLASIGVLEQIKSLALRDEWLKVQAEFTSSKKADFWRLPIETISMSEAGFERVYQASIVMPNWKIHLEPGKQWQVRLIEKLTRI